jgi:hypothetical protein
MDELKHSICERVACVEVSKLKLVSNSLFKTEVCLRAEERHFEDLI